MRQDAEDDEDEFEDDDGEDDEDEDQVIECVLRLVYFELFTQIIFWIVKFYWNPHQLYDELLI